MKPAQQLALGTNIGGPAPKWSPPAPPLPFVAHSATSHAAARKHAPRAAGGREAVLAALVASADGLTDEQICEASQLSASTERPRRGELVAAGSVRDSGRTRLTRSGSRAVVWVAV